MGVLDTDNRPTLTASGLGLYGESVVLGSVLGESISYPAEITGHPIEGGSTVNDHVHVKPIMLSLTCRIGEETCVSSISSAIDAGASALGLSDKKSLKDRIELLTKWWKQGELLLYTGPVLAGGILNALISDPYESIIDDLVIQNLELTRDSGTAFEFTIELKQVTIVKSRIERVKLPPGARPVGRQTGESTVTKEVEGVGSSNAHNVFGFGS